VAQPGRGAGWPNKGPILANATAKLPDQRKNVTTAQLDHESGLYRHKKRPEWGVAILAWEKDDRRAYQFEDGRLRKFRKGYYSLLESVDELERRSPETVAKSLEHAIETNRGKEAPKVLEPVASFKAQIELFLELYPKGFQDAKWISDHRDEPSGRTLKRHRDPAVREIQEALAADRCATLLAEDAHTDLAEAAVEILAGTSLVALKHVKVLQRLDEPEARKLAESIADLFHGEGDYDPRYKQHLEVLTELYGGRPSWRLATALPALMFPQEQVCVRRSAFMRQAAVVAPKARYSRLARASSYRNFRRGAFAVRKRLQAAGHEPRDLLDVHDFIWATLRNAALDHLGS
jgi:hypothetical protein